MICIDFWSEQAYPQPRYVGRSFEIEEAIIYVRRPVWYYHPTLDEFINSELGEPYAQHEQLPVSSSVL